jgi:hypothetical protein
VSLTVVLNSGPLGLVTNSKQSPQSLACDQWLQAMVSAGIRVILRLRSLTWRCAGRPAKP